jgi:predicted dithiol-disulfide oxidoreductase (DUF899 family)
MSQMQTLAPAMELAKRNGVTYANESDAYRQARIALLAEEIELRRQIERVAEMRRALPPGHEVTARYRFIGENGPTDLDGLFGDKSTLVVYSFMFGPQRARPCPMCTSLLGAWDGEARDIEQRVALAVVARSPLERLVEFKQERGWRHLKLYSDPDGAYARDYHSVLPDGSDIPAFDVFMKRDGKILHFYSGEMGPETSDPGQDPRGAPDFMPLWNVLDMTPEGRGGTWYPKLDYTN